jgi:type IV pilus assembly protein PilM
MLILGGSGKTTVGLDIGSHSVKVVELDRSGKAMKLSRFAVVELAPGTVVDGEVVNRDHLVSAIGDAFTKAGIKPKSVNSAVSGRSVIVRRIPMEKMTEAQARQAIHWEAEQHIPFRVDEVSIDFKIINEEAAPGQMEVLLVAAKKDVIHLHRGLIQGAGLRTASVDLEQFALLRAYQHAYSPSEEECVTILNIGADNTNLVIAKNGIPSFNRDLAIGGTRFVEAVQRFLGFDYDTAEGVLRGNLPEGVSAEDVKNAVSSVIQELSTSVRRSFISFQASGESTRIDKMYISGGCSLMPELASILSEQHGLPVERFSPFRSVQIEPGLVSEEEQPGLDALLAVATGLALRGFVAGEMDINILPEEEKQKAKTAGAAADASPFAAVVSWLPLGLVVVCIVLLGLHYMNMQKTRDSIRADIVSVDADIARMQEQLSRQLEVNALEQSLNQRRAAIASLSLQQKSTVYILEYLCRALYPQQSVLAEEAGKSIYLTDLSLMGANLQITGIARSWGDIIEFQRRLSEISPDGTRYLFQTEQYGQSYDVAAVTDGSGRETRYRFSMSVGINQTSLEPLVGDFAGM